MGLSLAQQIAALPEAEREAALKDVDPDALLWDADFWLRPEQLPPATDDWNVWLFSAGRGAGKTRAAAEWVRKVARTPDLRIGLVARTSADVRDVIIEGDSGILNVSPPSERPEWQPSKRKLTWPNGTTALSFSSDEPSQLRGPQFHYAWADELAAWREVPDEMGMSAWANLRIATRLGRHPQIAATTTPKKVKVMRELIKEAAEGTDVVLSRGSTADNAGNLSSAYLNAIYGIYAGTNVSRQELFGEMIDDIEGALWTEQMIENARVGSIPMGLPLRVVGVDPTVAERPGDECGIVVVFATAERETYQRQAYVVDDQSVQGSPETWASRVVLAARKWNAPVIAETNQGGALVKAAIHAVDPGVPVLEVHSRYGKAIRAEPVALAYEQARVHHLGVFADLENQLLNWEPGVGKSPDRLDALVHAITALLVAPPQGMAGGKITATSAAGRSLGEAGLVARPGRPKGAVQAGPYGRSRSRARVIDVNVLPRRGRGWN